MGSAQSLLHRALGRIKGVKQALTSTLAEGLMAAASAQHYSRRNSVRISR